MIIIMTKIKMITLFVVLSVQVCTIASSIDSIRNELKVNFKGDAKIEVGSYYAGLAFHHSSPLPQRISFYYPAANSIDLSTDYWKRDSTFAMVLGLETDNVKEWLGFEQYAFTSTPYSVSFYKEDTSKSVLISYTFCHDKPAFVLNITIKNLSSNSGNYKLFTNLESSLRTSHTYAIKDRSWSEYDNNSYTLFINNDDRETQNTRIFLTNAGDKPSSFSSRSSISSLPLEDNNWWKGLSWDLKNELINEDNQSIPSAKFLYEKELSPGESLNIIQIIGTAKEEEKLQFAEYLSANYENEVKDFEKYVLEYAVKNTNFTGDEILDKSILWAKALLAVNQHYIDGSIQPMPCPAEYNFYFTHDVLLTDLAVVNFDLPRVKKDLEFIIMHADNNYIIPHAYYWKDSVYNTELVTTDGWNHFWFVILAVRYIELSADTEFADKLYPYIRKSIQETLQGEKDGIMYAYRPDWWDIGTNYGPRSYMTILAVKALQEFVNLSKMLGIKDVEVDNYSTLAAKMQQNLNDKLWSDERNYLINYYNDGSEDPHYYMGSLVAVYFGLLNEERSDKLLTTAKKYLLDENIGVYTVYPMDFHTLTDFFKFSGNEAGDPHKYANGGIWPHCNAFYALALIKRGRKEEALNFIKTTMTIDGIINSPNGHPAMYEYRNSNKHNPQEYGQIDKPQFMWAAGWYLYCLYELELLK
jgi:hypothetical protein